MGTLLPPDRYRVVAPSVRGISPIDWGYLRRIRSAVRKESIDILHAHTFDTAFYASLAVTGSPVRVVATFHGAGDLGVRGARGRIKRLAMRRLDAIACVSTSLVPDAERRFTRVTDIRVIHNGTDLSRFDQARNGALRARLGLAEGTRLIGALGNVRPAKGYPFLLEATALLLAGGHDVHVVIAGDDRGRLADDLRRQRETLGLTRRVTFLGFVDDPGAMLRGLDVFVLPSTTEGFSLATVQAMATGLPVVATRSGGPAELVEDGVSGVLVPTGSGAELARGLESVLLDSVLARRLGDAASARARALFSLDTMLGRYLRLYREVRSR